MKQTLFVIFVSYFLHCHHSEKIPYSHYQYEVTIEPSRMYLTASLQLSYVHPFESTDSLSFLLYENMKITSLESDAIDHFVFDTAGASPNRYTPAAGVLKIRLKKEIHNNERINLQLDYQGRIDSVNYWQTNRLTKAWVELGNYTPWFPYNPDLNTISFKIDAVIEDGYKIESNGEIDKVNNHWVIENSHVNNDMIICASKNFTSKEILGDNYTLKFTSAAPFSDKAIDSILAAGERILINFSLWFGTIDLTSTKILVTPRKTGGGYARKGMIVLSKIDEDEFFNKKANYIRYFSHEFSHFWWSNAPTDSWEDWLNEAFAEYSAMLSVRELIGEKAFEQNIQEKSVYIDSLPPIRGLDRNHQKAYDVLYNKACYLLYALEDEVGQKEFISFMKLVFSNRISNTDDLITLIAATLGQEKAQLFNANLNK